MTTGSALAGAVLAILEASAPSKNTSPGDQDQIVITGERVPRTLHETASSVAVFTGNEVDGASGADRMEQLLELIPNVQLGSGGEGPTIRGQDTTGAMRDLPAFLGGTRPRTTLIVDGRAVSFNEFVFGVAPLWDVERIEVFRSPQTTTQGRNSIAGAIFVHSRDPSFEWEGKARAIAGDFRTRQLSAAVSGPLVGNDAAFRVTGDWRKSRTASDIADRMRGADPNRDEYWTLRARLIAEPSVVPGMRLGLTYSHSESQSPQIEGVRAPFKERRDPIAGYGVFGTNVDSLTGTMDFNPAPTLSNRTVVSAGHAKIRRYAAPGLGEARTDVRDWAAETVLDWRPRPSLRLTGGLSYQRASLDQLIDLSQLIGIGEFDDEQRSLGLFGEAQWSPWRRFEIVAGLRYQRDRQSRGGALSSASLSIPLDYNRSFQAWLPKLSLTYDFNADLRVGLLAQRAYNPGGATLRFDTGLPDELGAERLWNFELFARAAINRSLLARLNLFRTDIDDAQRSRSIPVRAPTGSIVGFADLYNVAQARSHGAEATVEWRSSARFTASAAVGLLATRIIKLGEAPAELADKHFQRAPAYTGSLAVDWKPLDKVRLSAQLRRNRGYFSDDANTPSRRVDGSTRADARASWQLRHFTLFGYGRNLLDKFYLTYVFSPTLATAGDPREFGIGLEARF